MVCVAVWRNQNLRTACNYFIVSLAATDIIVPVFSLPLNFAFAITGYMLFPDWVCQGQAYILVTMTTLSVTTITQTAVHRYLKVVHPQRCPNKKTVLNTIIGTWVFMLLLPSFYFIQGFKALFYPKNLYCFIELKNVTTVVASIAIIGLLLNLVVIAFCYGKVLATVRKHKQNTRQSLQRNPGNRSRQSQEEEHITKVFLAVVIGFIFCWTPAYLMWMLYLYHIDLPTQFHLFSTISACISSCINPFIYGLLNKAFKAEFKKMLHFWNRNDINPF